MAHFAKLGIGNKVLTVESVHNDVATTEQAGIDFLKQLHNDSTSIWKQTSYNRNIRKNFAGVGYKYDQTRDAFIPPTPYPSWTLNETTCLWDPPVPMPTLTQEQIDNNNYYAWNEETQQWDLDE